MVLGRPSLTTPMMDYSKFTKLYVNTDSQYDLNRLYNELNPHLFLYASDHKILWMMEGVSISVAVANWGPNPQDAWNVRCVRNLGTDLTSSSSTVQNVYTYNSSSRKVLLPYYDSNSIRQEKLTSIIAHDVADATYNKVYKGFEYSSTEYAISALTGYSDTNTDDNNKKYADDWAYWLNHVNPCNVLNTGGQTGWRVPNQKEIAIMKILGVSHTYQHRISATFDHFNNSGNALNNRSEISTSNFHIMCATKDNVMHRKWLGTSDNNQIQLSNSGVRCVRDIDN